MVQQEILARLLVKVVQDATAPRNALQDELYEQGRWTEPELLRLVLAHPAADGPRLLYADWCEGEATGLAGVRGELMRYAPTLVAAGAMEITERTDGGKFNALRRREQELVGLAERGEFIRVQVELAGLMNGKHPAVPGAPLPSRRDRERCVVLARREGELFNRAAANTIRDVWGVGGAFRHTIHPHTYDGRTDQCCLFRRGFVSTLTLPAEVWLGGVCGRCGGTETPGMAPEDDHPALLATCPSCQGSGRTPGHADALVAAAPIERVRLTTWPFRLLLEGRGDPADLNRRWPGIQFELPSA